MPSLGEDLSDDGLHLRGRGEPGVRSAHTVGEADVEPLANAPSVLRGVVAVAGPCSSAIDGRLLPEVLQLDLNAVTHLVVCQLDVGPGDHRTERAAVVVFELLEKGGDHRL